MNTIFDFPVYHKECDTCNNRFKCMTIKIHKEYLPEVHPYGKHWILQEYLPFYFGLKCFKVEPYHAVKQIELTCQGKGGEDYGMVVSVR